jgi:hypothetical protein
MRQLLLFYLVVVCSCSDIWSQPYFQQEVNYRISVSLNDSTNSLSGFETIYYINHSPDKLKFLYFHLWANAYKNKSTAFNKQQLEFGNTEFQFARESQRGYIDSLEFRINGNAVHWELCKDSIDICRLILTEPLQSGDSLIITTPFYVKIPAPFSRCGHIGQSYFITQWYPKPAVYDRTGWHKMTYLDQGEFYGEYGKYDVSITLPAKYIVGATGNLMNSEERAWLENKAANQGGDEETEPEEKLKTLHYSEKNIHDFAWFADKNYHVARGEVILPGGHKVTTWAMFPKEKSEIWSKALEYLNDALQYYSEWYGNYPYDQCSAVYGAIESAGAMEYPTITIIGDMSSQAMLEDYILHEVGHNWFYGILGSNERRYPYMDEGLNTFSELRYIHSKYPNLKLFQLMFNHPAAAKWLNMDKRLFGNYYYYAYLFVARTKSDQPMDQSSADYTPINYGAIVYFKSALAFTYLMNYLGEPEFNRIMRQYYIDWQFKHPGPIDLKEAFEKGTGKDLSWLFKDIITTTKTMDYSIQRYSNNMVLVRNDGEISSPVYLTAYAEGLKKSAWYPGFKGKKWLDVPLEKPNKLVLFDSLEIPEIHNKDNTFRTHGPLKWVEPLNVHLIQLLEYPDKTEIGILPAVGWNYYNKTMLGVLLYSPLVPQQTIEYQVMPMYGFGNHDVAGMGRIALNLYPDYLIFKGLQFSLNARRFGYAAEDGSSYNQVKGEMLVTLKNRNATSPVINTLKFNLISADQSGSFSLSEFQKNIFINIDANYTNLTVLNPHSVNLNFEVNNDYVRTSLDMHYTHALKYSKDAIQVRFYASTFLNKEADFSPFYSIRLSGASGLDDYKYEHLYLGRFENVINENHVDILAQQFVATEGGFASYDPYAASDRWLTSLGVVWRIPKIPACLYANTGTYSGAGQNVYEVQGDKQVSDDRFAYEMGGMIRLGNFLKIYFPFVVSPGISQFYKAYTSNYWQMIRYSINFNAINPFKLKNHLY